MEVLAVLLLTVSAGILFATEAIRIDVVAVVILVALALSGIVGPEQALSGFANPATATVAAMFVLTAGLRHTGLVEAMTDALGKVFGGHPVLLLPSLLLVAGSMSAFVNNTATVAIFIPVVLGLGKSHGTSPTQVLMPLSFAAQVGGTCTLIGSSTNILVSEIARRAGQPAFGMFEFSLLGLCFAGLAFVYLAQIAPLVLNGRSRWARPSLADRYALRRFMAELAVEADSPWVGRTLGHLALERTLDVDILELIRGTSIRFVPDRDDALCAGDVLLVVGPIHEIFKARAIPGLSIRRDMGVEGNARRTLDFPLVEAVVPPASTLVGRTLEEVRFRQARGCHALAIRHHERIERQKVGRVRLAVGDVLLLQGRRRDIDDLRASDEVILLEEVPFRGVDWRRAVLAIAILLAVVTGAAAGVASVFVMAVAGAAAVVVTRVITMEQAYASIDWKVIFLLAGVIPLGLAIETTGAANLLGGGIVRAVGDFGPVAVLSAFYLVTAVLTEILSNNATAALLTPIALATAQTLGVDPRPLLVAIMFAASTAFMTPIGYQTNAMVHGPGRYRFSDFIRVGLPLNAAFWFMATILIPRFFSF